jgi:carbon monoxide dehydrogenase subunit G
MRFEDSFVVPVAPDVAWEALTDIARVAPCLPGAEVVEITDDEFHGLVKLKLGPITANYKGTARFESLDKDKRELVIVAQGRDRHGQGTASARVEANLTDHDGATLVTMVQQVDITGKAAQFGRGVLADVSKQMMGRFAKSLTEMLTAPEEPPAPAGGEATGTTEPSPASSNGAGRHTPNAEPLDVVSIARGVAAERAPALAGALLLGVLLLLWARRR